MVVLVFGVCLWLWVGVVVVWVVFGGVGFFGFLWWGVVVGLGVGVVVCWGVVWVFWWVWWVVVLVWWGWGFGLLF
ncbi:hypothetical protein BV369_30935, partial [Klebsiella pneumoniae]